MSPTRRRLIALVDAATAVAAEPAAKKFFEQQLESLKDGSSTDAVDIVHLAQLALVHAIATETEERRMRV